MMNDVAELQGVEMSSRVEELRDVPSNKLELAKNYAAEIAKLNNPNVLYQRCFQLLKLGGLEAEIPRLVVFGQQSMGKTTLLDMIMGGPVGYSSTDTGTKMPVVIMLKPAEDGGADDDLCCVLGGQPMPVSQVERAMREIMSSADNISREELELEISIPGSVHAVFVDLPGIKDDSKEGAELTRDVVRTYVQNNPNDLYLLVKKASDDPANWPWSLREFILTVRPKGLGLKPQQTMVVGTRSRDFLQGEKNDITSQDQLWKRVQKRAVKDSESRTLPLYLLELFSLSVQDKETMNFEDRRKAMEAQIKTGKLDCMGLINSFEYSNPTVKDNLERIFDYEIFRKDLNTNFQNLLNEQLGVLEKRLSRKRSTLIKDVQKLEKDLIEQHSRSLRGSIEFFFSEFMAIVTGLVTGNYMILRLPNGGVSFLDQHGGTLRDNLQDGHELAIEIFPDEQVYDRQFLSKMEALDKTALDRIDARRNNERRAEMQTSQQQGDRGPNATAAAFRAEMPSPDRTDIIRPGQFVRYAIPRDGTQMFGFVKSIEASGTEVECCFTVIESADGVGTGTAEVPTDKMVDKPKTKVVLPLSLAISPTTSTNKDFRAWHKVTRTDGWIGLEPVLVKSIGQLTPIANPWLGNARAETGGAAPGTAYDAKADCCKVDVRDLKGGLLQTTQNLPGTHNGQGVTSDKMTTDESSSAQIPLSELFIDAEVFCGGGNWNLLTPLQRIAGDHAEKKLLNQVSLMCCLRWLKFHICNIEPEKRYKDNVLLQMMRAVKHVVDKADAEPLVADLLQSNVQSGILQLAKLAACATSVALRRILRAALAEVQRLVESGDLKPALLFLVQSPAFMEEVHSALEEYCREQASTCADEMRDFILQQTHAIHFEMIEDIFDNCRQFEAEFLGDSTLRGLSQKVREGLAIRKQRLMVADIYAKGSAGTLSEDLIYEEVRVHFWVVKTLLASPLTTKLYMAYINDIKDKSLHLASEARSVTLSESSIEQNLQRRLLWEVNTTGSATPRTEEDLRAYFQFESNKKALKMQLAGAQRAAEYAKLALQSVSRLRVMMAEKGGVDFLTKLEFAEPKSPTSPSVCPSAQSTEAHATGAECAPPTPSTASTIPGVPLVTLSTAEHLSASTTNSDPFQ